MIKQVAPVISRVVANDMCVGCGACVAVCSTDSLKMQWNEDGFLVPMLAGECGHDGSCIKVCPFNPEPSDDVRTETEIAAQFLTDAPYIDKNIGRYFSTYVGYAEEYRKTSSSGGLATYIAANLLKSGVVDHVLAVLPGANDGDHYSYQIASSPDDLLSASRTRYFPVTADSVLKSLAELKGNVAFVGVACFVKAVRLAQARDPEINAKVRFVIGIICGGLKSAFFTNYLAGLSGTTEVNIRKPQYRIKDEARPASDYSFGHVDARTGADKTIRMRLVGDMWGTGLFKANACDFCDDVTTELADISVGDAWLPPYVADGRGTSVIVTRSAEAERLISNGIATCELSVEKLPFDRFKQSQQGSFNHRQYGLPVRIAWEKRSGHEVSPKRFDGRVHPEFRFVLRLRRWVRKKSFSAWRETRNSKEFDRRMASSLWLLRVATRMNQRLRGLRKRLGG